MEHAVAGYVRGQLLLSAIIGTSAGVGIWLLGTLGWVPGIDQYAALFGAWVAFTELIPYLGPWLGGDPADRLRARRRPDLGALGRSCSSSGSTRSRGTSSSRRSWGARCGCTRCSSSSACSRAGSSTGCPGVFVALPLLAVMRAIYEFFSERVELEDWKGGAVPVEVDVEETRPIKPVPPEEPPEAKVAP